MANMFKSAADKSTISGNKKETEEIIREKPPVRAEYTSDIPLAPAETQSETSRPGRKPSSARNSHTVEHIETEEQNHFVEQLLADKIPFKPTGKSYSIYMEDDIIAAVDNLAAKLHTNRSKTINTLLRSVLFQDK